MFTYYLLKKSFWNDNRTDIKFIGDGCDTKDLSDVIRFTTLESAQSYLYEIESENYHLSHNEAGRPDIVIVDEDVAYDWEYLLSHEDMGDSQYNWDHCDCPFNPTDIEQQEACDNLEEFRWNNLKPIVDLRHEYRHYRSNLGTQREVANMLGIQRLAISKRENGETKVNSEMMLALYKLTDMHKFVEST